MSFRLRWQGNRALRVDVTRPQTIVDQRSHD
ncbi:MAG: hypothetical protein J0I23_12380 [Rhizobiales bacterium]|nr:hypothetical protein [Hyphomicrobiales bacterium]